MRRNNEAPCGRKAQRRYRYRRLDRD